MGFNKTLALVFLRFRGLFNKFFFFFLLYNAREGRGVYSDILDKPKKPVNRRNPPMSKNKPPKTAKICQINPNGLFLGRNPSATSPSWKEWQIQAYIVREARRNNFIVHGDQNGASRTPRSIGMASATGMLKGWPDMCFILSSGPLWMELKLADGKLSLEQVELHSIMQSSGCRIFTIYADCPAAGWNKVLDLIN